MTDQTPESLAAEFVAKHGIEEAAHYEAFISALHGITAEEHSIISQYLRLQRLGIPTPMPSCYLKYENKPPVDDRFWQLVWDHGMTENVDRATFVMNMALRLQIEEEQAKLRKDQK